MMGLFGNKAGSSGSRTEAGRTARFSSGWAQLSRIFQAQENLRVLDIGPTSAGNINLITQLGHSVYMANLAEEGNKPEWRQAAGEPGEEPGYDAEGFLRQNLDFAGRGFDVVLLFDALDYLPAPLVQPVVDRLSEVLTPGGYLLAFFHSKATGPDTTLSRYHLTLGDQLDLQRIGAPPVAQIYSNRQIEQIFGNFASSKFFLAKDALREVLLTR